MAKFCTKCGKSSKPGVKFCTSCGGAVKVKKVPKPAAPETRSLLANRDRVSDSPPPPPRTRRRGGSGCSGCLMGCLISGLISLLISAVLIGGAYYFFTQLKKAEPGDYFEIDNPGGKVIECGDSLSCVEENIESCSKASGEADLGEFASVEFEVMGKSGTSCVVFAKIVDINELPEGMDMVPSFILDIILKDLSMECLIPRNIYTGGVEKIGGYISDNMVDVCEGPLFDMAEKFNVDLSDM